MHSLLFPGQGSQSIGMGLELYNNFDLVKKIFNQADEKLNFKISKIILEGPSETLQLTQNTQPAILIVSYSIFQVMRKEFNFDFSTYKYFAGHSLGEYSALVCANSLNFEDALYLLSERGKAMQKAVPVGKGQMIAVLGSKIEDINNLLKEKISKNTGICEIANDNAEGQVIISGDNESVKLFQLNLKEKKIKTLPLKVSAPFHCSLMQSAADSMKQKIKNTEFKKPSNKIIHNVTAQPSNVSENIQDLLVKQICSSVRWRESLINMAQDGVKNFVEIGPGKALSGMVKRTLKNVNSFSINSITDIKNLENEFKK